MSFIDRLDAALEHNGSLLCVGLDTAMDDAASAERACVSLITATSEFCSAYKLNMCFFEQFGSGGLAALERIRRQIPPTHIVILDGKRGDIGTSAAAYARAAFDVFDADAATVNPLMGGDAVSPFLTNPDRGAFILTRTSNPGAADILEQRLADGRPVYARIVDLALTWNTNGNVGFVVGATDPEAVATVRTRAPHLPLLLPGVGTQGGSVEAAVAAGIDKNGRGLVVVVGRSITSAPDPALAARGYRDQLIAAVEGARQPQ